MKTKIALNSEIPLILPLPPESEKEVYATQPRLGMQVYTHCKSLLQKIIYTDQSGVV